LRLHICLLAEQMCLLCPGVEAGQRVFEQQGENNSSLSCRHTLPPTAILLKGRKNTLLQGRCMLRAQYIPSPTSTTPPRRSVIRHCPDSLKIRQVAKPSRPHWSSTELWHASPNNASSPFRSTTLLPQCHSKASPIKPHRSTNHPAGLSSGTVLIPSRSAKLLVAPQVRPQALSAYSLRIRQTALVWRAQHTSATNPMRQCALPAFLRNPTNCPPSHPTRKVPQCRRRSI